MHLTDDRERKLYRIIYNVYHMKHKPSSLKDLVLLTALTEDEVKETLRSLHKKKRIIHIGDARFVAYEHRNHYKYRKSTLKHDI
jgi:hypothetical protein